MKRRTHIISQYMPWLMLLFGVNLFWTFLLWIANVQAFYAMAVMILLVTILLFTGMGYALIQQEEKRRQVFLEFLDSPDEYHEALLCRVVHPAHRDAVGLLSRMLRDNQMACAALSERANDYEEYVESWAHEIKTPLSLLTFLLDNRRDDLPATVGFKLDYVRNRMQESIDQMLFYARLKSARKDYLLEEIHIDLCVEEALEEYKPLLEEKGFKIQCCLPHHTVYTDRRGLRFLLGQAISNSVKYCGKEPELRFFFGQEGGRYVITVQDNGIGVRSCDLPYIFEKGFTGDSGDGRKKATGMGLYLAGEIAQELQILLHVQSQWGKGFEMKFSFPVVDDPEHDQK